MKKNILKPASIILALGITSVLLSGCTGPNNEQPTNSNSSSASASESKNFTEAKKVVEAYLDAIADGNSKEAKTYLEDTEMSNVILDNDDYIAVSSDKSRTIQFVFTEQENTEEVTSTPTPATEGTDDIAVETITIKAENKKNSKDNIALELVKLDSDEWKITKGAYMELTLPTPLKIENEASQQVAVNGVAVDISKLPADDDTDGYTIVNVYPSVYKISYTTMIGEKEVKEEITTVLQSGEEYITLDAERRAAIKAKEDLERAELEK